MNLKDANLISVTACFYSKRFWQYVFIKCFSTLPYFATYIQFKENENFRFAHTQWVKALTCLFTGYIFSMTGFKSLMMPVVVIQTIFIIVVYARGEDFDYKLLLWKVGYYLYIIVEEINVVICIAAVPRTFGIRHGASVLCLVLCSRLLSVLMAWIIGD